MKFFKRDVGFTKAGLELPSMEEMIERNYQYIEEKTGRKFDRASDGPIGQLFEISSKFWLDTWKQLQVFVGLFAYPRGIFADWYAGYTGFKRLPAVKASAILDVYGLTTASAKQANLSSFSDVNGKSWERNEIIDNMGVSLTNVTDNVNFPVSSIRSFIIDWSEYKEGETGDFVVFNHQTNIPYMTIEAKSHSTKAQLQNLLDTFLNRFNIIKNFQGKDFWYFELSFGQLCSLSFGGGKKEDNIWLKMVATPFQISVQSSDYTNGEVLGSHSITNISSSATGVIACNNSLPIARARGSETDLELLQRMQYSRRLYGGASALSIEQRIRQEIPNVSFCRVLENTFNAPLQIRPGLVLPPKSIFPIIEGGSFEGISNFLFKYVPATCICFGTDKQNVKFIDSPITLKHKSEVAIGWSVPKPRYVELRIEILEYNRDQPFPVDGFEQIKQEILNWSYGRFSVGADLFLKDFYTPINKVVGSGVVKISQRNIPQQYKWKETLWEMGFSEKNIELWDEYVHIDNIQVI